jgi:hypothetical protein
VNPPKPPPPPPPEEPSMEQDGKSRQRIAMEKLGSMEVEGMASDIFQGLMGGQHQQHHNHHHGHGHGHDGHHHHHHH